MKKKRKPWWIWIVIAFYIGFIFHYSLQNAVTSEDLSMGISTKILQVINHYGFYIDINLFNHYIRKLAHFSEFALLGFLILFGARFCPLVKSRLLTFLIFLFAVPYTDETIQKFSDGRASMVSDMVLDGCGYLFGGLVAYILVLIIADIFVKKHR